MRKGVLGLVGFRRLSESDWRCNAQADSHGPCTCLLVIGESSQAAYCIHATIFHSYAADVTPARP